MTKDQIIKGIEGVIRECIKPTMKASLNGKEILFCNYTETTQAIYNYLKEVGFLDESI